MPKTITNKFSKKAKNEEPKSKIKTLSLFNINNNNNVNTAKNKRITIQENFSDYIKTIKDNEKIINTHSQFKNHFRSNSTSLSNTGFEFSASNFKDKGKNNKYHIFNLNNFIFQLLLFYQ